MFWYSSTNSPSTYFWGEAEDRPVPLITMATGKTDFAVFLV